MQYHHYAVWCHHIHFESDIQEITHLMDVGSDFSETALHKAEVIIWLHMHAHTLHEDQCPADMEGKKDCSMLSILKDWQHAEVML